MRFESTGQVQITGIDILCGYAHRNLRRTIGVAGRKCRINPTFRTYMLHINFANHQLPLKGEAFTAGQQRTILINQSIAGKNHIRSRFAKTT